MQGGAAGGRQAETPTPPAAEAQADPDRAFLGDGPGLVAAALQQVAETVVVSLPAELGHLHTHSSSTVPFFPQFFFMFDLLVLFV